MPRRVAQKDDGHGNWKIDGIGDGKQQLNKEHGQVTQKNWKTKSLKDRI